jgi:hypothetical protein
LVGSSRKSLSPFGFARGRPSDLALQGFIEGRGKQLQVYRPSARCTFVREPLNDVLSEYQKIRRDHAISPYVCAPIGPVYLIRLKKHSWASFLHACPTEGPAMIRWEHEGEEEWIGFSGELPVAKVIRDGEAERESWNWQIHAIKRPNGWRKPVGHRITSLDARRSAEEYWAKWLSATALQPDVAQLARGSLALEGSRKGARKWSRG